MNNTAALTSTFEMSASYDRDGRPQSVSLYRRFATQADAQEFVTTLPKGVRAKPTTLHTHDGAGNTVLLGLVAVHFQFVSNGTTGAVNEAAQKRYRQMVKAFSKLGVEVEYTTPYSNSYPTQAEFEAAAGVAA